METVDIGELQRFYAGDEAAHRILDHLASRKRDRGSTTVNRLQANLESQGRTISRGQVIRVLKRLQQLGCGRFMAGRKGWASRFEWGVGMVDVGRAAAGAPVEPGLLSARDAEEADDEELGQVLDHPFQLRRNLTVTVSLPDDLTPAEAGRVADFIKTLPFVN